MRIAWSAAGNPAQTMYEVRYSSDPANYWHIVSTDSLLVDLAGLADGTAYYNSVRSVNGAGIRTAYAAGTPAVTLSSPSIASLTGVSSGGQMHLTLRGGNFCDGDLVRLEKSGQAPVGAIGTPIVGQANAELSADVDLTGLPGGAWNVVVFDTAGFNSGTSGDNLVFVSTIALGGGITQGLIDSAVTSTITIPGSSEQVFVPPGLITNGYILVSTSPTENPIGVATGTILTATRNLPHGYMAINVREYAAYSNNAPQHTFAGLVTFVINYQDSAPADGIVDGTNMREQDLKLVTLNGTDWSEVPAAEYDVDAVANTITARRTHFSVYALLGVSVSATIDRVRIYPVPWQPNSTGKFGSATVAGCGSGLVFDDLTSEGIIRIYTIPGDLVRELPFHSSDSGCKVWDGKNAAGQNVASGVYVAIIKNAGAGGGSSVKKLAVER